MRAWEPKDAPPMDATNLRILDLLQRDARMSVADIARQVGRAESTVRERIAALESNGIVRGYRAHVDHYRTGHATRAVIRASCDLPDLPAMRDRLGAIPQVTRVLVTTGQEPLLIEVVTRDLEALQRLLVERIGPLGLDRVGADIVVDELVDRPLPFEAPREEAAAFRTSRDTLVAAAHMR